MQFARHNIQHFPADVDAIVTNAAGCGSGMKEYELWLAGDPAEDAARRFAEKVVDVSKLLYDLGPAAPGDLPQPMTVAYHDACHLAHAQKIKSQPRQLLKQIGRLELVEVPNGEICCGSAGTYNIEQPEIARQLGRGKAEAIAATGADAVATGNIGCMAQIQAHLEKFGRPLPVYHTMELLDMATVNGHIGS
jgi:glycolate oxidase iron-sulfur subunit